MPRKKTSSESRAFLAHAEEALMSRTSALSGMYASMLVFAAIEAVMLAVIVPAAMYWHLNSWCLLLLVFPLLLIWRTLERYLALHDHLIRSGDTDALRSETYLTTIKQLEIQAKNHILEEQDLAPVEDGSPPPTKKRVLVLSEGESPVGTRLGAAAADPALVGNSKKEDPI